MIAFTINNQKVDGKVQISDWIINGLSQITVQYAEEFGKNLAGYKYDKEKDKYYNDKNVSLSTSQFRNIYGEVQKMKMRVVMDMKEKDYREFRSSLFLLKPRLSYAAKRDGKKGSQDLNEVMSRGIDVILEAIDKEGFSEDLSQKKWVRYFDNFANFFEAVLAYHRAFGGK